MSELPLSLSVCVSLSLSLSPNTTENTHTERVSAGQFHARESLFDTFFS